jgi:PEP-CTERM motif-containing protein
MKARLYIGIVALLLLVSGSPAAANTIPIPLGPLVPVGSCVPTAGFTCVGPTSVTAPVAGLGTITISGFSNWPNTPGNISVTLDSNSPSQVPYLGVYGGNNLDEIDVQTSELLQISFSQPVFVTTIDFNKLFVAGVRGDTNNEVAGVNFLLGNLFLTSFYFGTQNGLLTVNNPIGNIQIDTIQFWAVPTSSATDSSNSDFGVSGLGASLTPVPEPGMLVLFGSGLVAIATRIRRRKSL